MADASWTELSAPEGEHPIRWRLHENELSVEFEIFDSEASFGATEADVIVSGFLKWDHCMNWQTNPECMAHFCTLADAERLTRAFAALYEAAPVIMPKSLVY